MEKKLIKVWTQSTRKAIVSNNLQEMMEKGATKLNIINITHLKAYLEDGTELDDEEIYESLPTGTVVYLLDENEQKPWEVSASDSFRSDSAVLETSNASDLSFEIVDHSKKLTSSPKKGLKLFAPWPAEFTIPTSMFSESLEKEAVSGTLSWSSKSELLKIIAEEIIKFTSNPSPLQRDIVARQLIKSFPNLKSNIGEGHEGWAQKIYDRVKNEARKKSIFSHKRKISSKKNKELNLEYSPKVQKILPKPTEDTEENPEAKERMLIEMSKLPHSRCSTVLEEGLKITYHERRRAVDSNTLLFDLQSMFPALFTPLGIKYDFKILYNMDLEESMLSSLESCSTSVEEYARERKRGGNFMNVPIGEDVNNKLIRTILLIPEILRDKSDFVYRMFPSEASMHDFTDTTHITPHLCIVGEPFSASEIYIVAEKKNLIECRNFIEGFFTLIGLYFVINIEYPKEAMATFKFFQSFILKLPCKNLPGKLITFCKALSS